MPCSHQLFHQMKTDYVEGEKKTQRKHSQVQTYIPPSHLNPLFMFDFLRACTWDFYHFCSRNSSVSQELVPLCKQKKSERYRGFRTTFIATRGFYHQYMVLTAMPSSACTGSSGSRSHWEKGRAKTDQEDTKSLTEIEGTEFGHYVLQTPTSELLRYSDSLSWLQMSENGSVTKKTKNLKPSLFRVSLVSTWIIHFIMNPFIPMSKMLLTNLWVS